jgi:FAD/FMN-containing dehydrogenase
LTLLLIGDFLLDAAPIMSIPEDLLSSGKTILSELLQRLSHKARVHLPFDDDKTSYDEANLRFTQYERPNYLVIVEPDCESDVVEVVKYARQKDIPFTPRGGHHAVTSSMRHFQNGICINMRSLNQMRWDDKQQHVTAGGGALTDEFVRFVHDLGMEVSELHENPLLVT